VKILVINISLRPFSPVKMFPVGLGYIMTAMKRAGFDFDFIDIDLHRFNNQEVEDYIGRKKYDAVCMGCIVTGYKIIKNLSEVIKRHHPKCKIIVGNSVATSIPDTLFSHTLVDIAVMGEGDNTIVELLACLSDNKDLREVAGIFFTENGDIVKNTARPVIKDISSLPFIDFSLFDVEEYIQNGREQVSNPLMGPQEKIRLLPVNTARGCVAKCTFCYHVFGDVPYRFRSVESICIEIKELINKYGINHIAFSDELSFYSKQRAREFSEGILKNNLKFGWDIGCRGNLFDSEEDLEIIGLMQKAGCLSCGYSLESADAEILKAMNKNVTVEQFSRQTRLIQRGGIRAITSLVLGYPQETPETIQKTFDCCIENKIYPSAGYLLPQPGSKMYDYAVEHGFITDEEDYLLRLGDRQDLRMNLTKMSDEEFESNVVEGLRRCNEALDVGLKDEELIKTQYYRSGNKAAENCTTEMVIPCEPT
jgi:radical SAM superfamily enzyme YgiQ (UPF0313 family)